MAAHALQEQRGEGQEHQRENFPQLGFDALPLEVRLQCLANCDWQTLARASCVNLSTRALVRRQPRGWRRQLRTASAPALRCQPAHYVCLCTLAPTRHALLLVLLSVWPSPPHRPATSCNVHLSSPAAADRLTTWCEPHTGAHIARSSPRCCVPTLPRPRSGRRHAANGR